MNKQRYLAELGQLLIFMTSADRALTLEKFGALFDEAGPVGAEALAGRIGSPTKNAIRLSRSYMPGCLTDEILFQGMDLDMPALEPEPAQEPEPEEEAEEAAAEEPRYAGPEMPDLSDMPELPDLPDAEAPAEEEPEPEAEDEDAGEPEEETPPAPAPAADRARFVAVPVHEDAPEEEEAPETEPEPPRRPAPHVERPMSLWLGAPLFILSLIVLGLPLAALVLVLVILLLVPGALVLGGAALAAT